MTKEISIKQFKEELNKLLKFIGVKEFTPPSLNKKINIGYTNDKRTNYRQSKYDNTREEQYHFTEYRF